MSTLILRLALSHCSPEQIKPGALGHRLCNEERRAANDTSGFAWASWSNKTAQGDVEASEQKYLVAIIFTSLCPSKQAMPTFF